ncbi:MAG: beta-lactamase domain protein [uncultured Solirubrobacterales bacterium]|uniref:Beta-lactamase domain protein n=1 Tax=uncultured Solirubrobacterales bacterium TaxID=768556 RepID=A0A6J4S6T3_9ACTN|nr:MAG: beta-lactamase domain protein [uncultured Solirubrobacterales bacterium]
MAAGGSLKMSPKPLAPTLEPIARGVWLMRGGMPKRTMNVYLLVDDGGVTMFDAGIEDMAGPLGEVSERMGGLKRIVLSHSHADHRGAAPKLGAPVHCHPDEVADAEGDGGYHYFELSKLESPVMRSAYPHLLRLWDGGPVSVAGTLSEGDEVAGFQVKHFPGHAPGLIGLWREEDRLALVSDTLYTLDPDSVLTPYGGPRLPHPAFTPAREQARESLRKLAALEPRAVWSGHARPVTGDVRRQLEHAADTT